MVDQFNHMFNSQRNRRQIAFLLYIYTHHITLLNIQIVSTDMLDKYVLVYVLVYHLTSNYMEMQCYSIVEVENSGRYHNRIITGHICSKEGI